MKGTFYVWNVTFMPEMFRRQGKNLRIGENQFGQNPHKFVVNLWDF